MISAQMEARGLLGRTGTDVESDGRHHPAERRFVEPGLAQALDSTIVRLSRSHRAEVADAGRRRRHDRGDIELGVVSQYAHRIARTEPIADLCEVAIRPIVATSSAIGKRPRRGEHHRARRDRDAKARS